MVKFGRLLVAVVSLVLLTGAAPVWAAPKYLFKVASLAPDGSVWAKRFDEFAAEVRQKSGGEIDFKIYAGGVMGDDRAMYRKMMIGQLQAGGFTMTGIGEVVPDFRVMGTPFFFRSYDEVDAASAKLFPAFQKAFRDKNLELVALTEVGFIYPMSTAPITTVAELKRTKCWAPQNDPLGQAFLNQIGVVPTQLSIPDVLASLQTGLVETVFNSFYGSIVLQWFTRTKYITDLPFGYAYGGLIFDGRTFAKLPPAHAALIHEAARRHFSKLIADTRQSNADSLKVLKEQHHIALVQPTPEAEQEVLRHREAVVKTLIGTAYSRQMYDLAMAALQERRAKPGKPARGR
ncbi:MAG TPA: TRAP transporter substrate-binding protein DctP [Desulfurivibrionaceae bacterium]|nr:TRAP transporter substrate-binding protein DctP [Desulfurivibrionaceae bacterium]